MSTTFPFARLLFPPVLLALPLSAQTCGEVPRDEQVIEQIKLYNQPFIDRGDSDIIAEKYQTMAESPFSFYRGTAHLFWWDAASSASANASSYLAGVPGDVWLQGDLHLNNFGVISDDDDLLYYDENDFDEAYPGPWIWDIRRLVTSLYLSAEALGLSSGAADDVAEACVQSFCEALQDFSDTEDELDALLTESNASGEVKDILQVAEDQTQLELLEQYADLDGHFSNAEGDLTAVSPALEAEVIAQLPAYVQSLPSDVRKSLDYYTVKDVAQRLHAGVGSLGYYRYYVLMEGSSPQHDDDRILDLKEARTSAVAGWLPNSVEPWSNDAERILQISRGGWENTRGYLGTLTLQGLPFRVLERQAEKASIDLEVDVGDDEGKLTTVAEQAGWLAARMLARADQDLDPMVVPFDADAAVWSAIQGDEAGFVLETLDFARYYAAQVLTDYDAFRVALAADPLLGG